MCEAGLHISLGIGLRLFNHLERDYQQLDLQLLLLESNGQTSSPVALLKQAQTLEAEAENAAESAQQKQTIHDWFSAGAASTPDGQGGKQ